MELNDFQKMALETAAYPENFKLVYPALGLNGEAGEVADKVKKIIRDEYATDNKGAVVVPEDKRQSLALEIGDVLWYVAMCAYDLGFPLNEIAEMNYRKLQSRKERNMLNGSGDNR